MDVAELRRPLAWSDVVALAALAREGTMNTAPATNHFLALPRLGVLALLRPDTRDETP